VVLERMRKGIGAEPAFITHLRAHEWQSEAQLKSLVERFAAMKDLPAEHVAWTSTDPTRAIRAAGLAMLKKLPREEALQALLPYLRTRSEAVRRAVQTFIKEIAGPMLASFLAEISDTGDDFARLAALDLARELPAERAFPIFRRILQDPHPVLRSRALRAVSETDSPGTSALAANLALPMLQDDDEGIRLAALAVLERNPSEALISHVLLLARSGGSRVAESAFSSLRRLLPVAQADHSPEVLPLLSDGSLVVRTGAMSLLEPLPPEDLARRFVEHFATTYAWVRDRAAEALREGIPGFVPAVVALAMTAREAVGTADESIARSAAEMTLTIPDARCIPVWTEMARDPDWWVRTRAIECLGRHGAGREDVLGLLLASLKEPELSISAAGALGDIGDVRAAAPLLEAFKGATEHPDDQMEFLEALARVGEKSPEKVAAVLANVARHPNVDDAVREKARRLVGRLSGDAARDAIPAARVAPRTLGAGEGAEATLVDFLADTVAPGSSGASRGGSGGTGRRDAKPCVHAFPVETQHPDHLRDVSESDLGLEVSPSPPFRKTVECLSSDRDPVAVLFQLDLHALGADVERSEDISKPHQAEGGHAASAGSESTPFSEASAVEVTTSVTFTQRGSSAASLGTFVKFSPVRPERRSSTACSQAASDSRSVASKNSPTARPKASNTCPSRAMSKMISVRHRRKSAYASWRVVPPPDASPGFTPLNQNPSGVASARTRPRISTRATKPLPTTACW